jgi:hypothetical protein
VEKEGAALLLAACCAFDMYSINMLPLLRLRLHKPVLQPQSGNVPTATPVPIVEWLYDLINCLLSSSSKACTRADLAVAVAG